VARTSTRASSWSAITKSNMEGRRAHRTSGHRAWARRRGAGQRGARRTSARGSAPV
jgi:hypothetical protein